VCVFGLSTPVRALSGLACAYQPSGNSYALAGSIRERVGVSSSRMTRHLVAYWAWTWAFHRYTGLCLVLQMTVTLPVSVRKDILGLCRTQSPLIPGSVVRKSLAFANTVCMIPSEPARHPDNAVYVSMRLLEIISLYPELFTDHLTSAIISHGLRIAPGIDENEYTSIMAKALSKELSASTNRFVHCTLDFRCIFSAVASHRSIPICDRLPPSEEVASDTYIHFCQLRTRFSGMLFYPRGGSKTVGRQVAEDFWRSYRFWNMTFKHEGDPSKLAQVTVDDCLRMYQETGGYPNGPVEMRTSWKYAQIGPRCYYARGGDVQVAAQYIQDIVNIMIDEFPEVHRVNRFGPPENMLDDDDVEIIYDYSSFTSNMDAVVPFIDNLSYFFSGTIIRLLDPREGIITADLGDLFLEYNRVCNNYQSFDIARVSPDLDSQYETTFQHTCGMLGVEGNIFLATLLHGLYLRFLSGLGRSKCIGDDARFHHKTSDGLLSNDDRDYAHWVLTGIGDLKIDSLAQFESNVDPVLQAFRYVKRPFHRDENIMIQGVLLPLPSQIPLLGALDEFHTVLPTTAHPCRNVFKQVIRFLDMLHIHSVRIADDVDDMSYPIVIHLSYLKRLLLTRDPDGKYSEIGRTNLKTHYRLPPVEYWGRGTYIEWLMRDVDYYETVRIPKCGGPEEENTCDGREGSVMIRTQTRARGFLVRMGYLEAEMMYDEISIDKVGWEMFSNLLSGRYAPVIRYTVTRTVPPWYARVTGAL